MTNPAAAQKLLIYRGINPLLVEEKSAGSVPEMVKATLATVIKADLVAMGDTVIVVHEVANGGDPLFRLRRLRAKELLG